MHQAVAAAAVLTKAMRAGRQQGMPAAAATNAAYTHARVAALLPGWHVQRTSTVQQSAAEGLGRSAEVEAAMFIPHAGMTMKALFWLSAETGKARLVSVALMRGAPDTPNVVRWRFNESQVRWPVVCACTPNTAMCTAHTSKPPPPPAQGLGYCFYEGEVETVDAFGHHFGLGQHGTLQQALPIDHHFAADLSNAERAACLAMHTTVHALFWPMWA